MSCRFTRKNSVKNYICGKSDLMEKFSIVRPSPLLAPYVRYNQFWANVIIFLYFLFYTLLVFK